MLTKHQPCCLNLLDHLRLVWGLDVYQWRQIANVETQQEVNRVNWVVSFTFGPCVGLPRGTTVHLMYLHTTSVNSPFLQLHRTSLCLWSCMYLWTSHHLQEEKLLSQKLNTKQIVWHTVVMFSTSRQLNHGRTYHNTSKTTGSLVKPPKRNYTDHEYSPLMTSL